MHNSLPACEWYNDKNGRFSRSYRYLGFYSAEDNIHCYVNFSSRTCTFYKPCIFLVFNNGVISFLYSKRRFILYLADKILKVAVMLYFLYTV